GEKTRAETTGLPKNRRRRSANEVRTPSVTAIRLETVATTALRPSAVTRTRFDRTSPYQWVVNPANGTDGSPSLNENSARTAIGRYRKITRSQKKTVSETRPALEVAISISRPPRIGPGRTVRTAPSAARPRATGTTPGQ